jgi:surface antigen
MKSMAPHSVLIIALLGIAGTASALESSDRYAMDETAQRSLEYARTHETTGWINPDTGTEGTFTPVATHEGPGGQICREYSITAIIGGREEQVYGIACRQPDGSWMEANSAPYREADSYQEAPPAPAPVAYAPAPVAYPWWGFLSNIVLSGNYCSDGFCVGGQYGGSYYPYGYPYRYGYPYGYGYSPYSLRFNYSYYDYDNHYRHRRHYRSHSGHGNQHYRYNGRSNHNGRSGQHARGRDARDGRSHNTHRRENRSHDRRSTGSRSRGDRSRGDRSGSSRTARVARNH